MKIVSSVSTGNPDLGRMGERNLHYSENVLDSPNVKPKWISEETEEEEEDVGE